MTAEQRMRRNPYPVYNDAGELLGWKWHNENFQECTALYETQREALKDMLAYMCYLENGPTWWQRIWWPLKEKMRSFWNDT
jgi:hypothetical protein